MARQKKSKNKVDDLLAWAAIAAVVLFASMFYYWWYLRLAHSTFGNYYVFRGCAQLLQRTTTYGTCKLADGKIIKIVLYNGKWYLDGDLPVCSPPGICF